jgi:hypothetical protein
MDLTGVHTISEATSTPNIAKLSKPKAEITHYLQAART